MDRPKLTAIMGATATGKSALAEKLASHQNAVLMNADAFQVYRGMDIGTAKPVDKSDYMLLDLVSPSESFGVGQWIVSANSELEKLYEKGQSVILVGGSGYYIRALLEGYDAIYPAPNSDLRAVLNARILDEGLQSLASELSQIDSELAAKTDLQNPQRVQRALEKLLSFDSPLQFNLPPFNTTKLAIDSQKEELEDKILRRFDNMMQKGWLQEVETLRASGYRSNEPGFRAHGYRYLYQVIEGVMDLADAKAQTIRDVCNYAKRQRTWLRKEPKLLTLNGQNLDDQFAEAIEL